MKKYWFLKCIKFVIFAIGAFIFFTWLVMQLWNWLIPELFDGKAVTFIQAAGILILSKILFSGFGRRCGGQSWEDRKGMWKERMKEKLEKLSPEEREKFKQKMAKCCGPFDTTGHTNDDNDNCYDK